LTTYIVEIVLEFLQRATHSELITNDNSADDDIVHQIPELNLSEVSDQTDKRNNSFHESLTDYFDGTEQHKVTDHKQVENMDQSEEEIL